MFCMREERRMAKGKIFLESDGTVKTMKGF
jgi:hypothetical protein